MGHYLHEPKRKVSQQVFCNANKRNIQKIKLYSLRLVPRELSFYYTHEAISSLTRSQSYALLTSRSLAITQSHMQMCMHAICNARKHLTRNKSRFQNLRPVTKKKPFHSPYISIASFCTPTYILSASDPLLITHAQMQGVRLFFATLCSKTCAELNH